MSQYGGGWQAPQWGPQRWPQQQWAQRAPHPGDYGAWRQAPRSRGNGCAAGCGVVALVGAIVIVAGLFVLGIVVSALDETFAGTTATTSSPRTPTSSASRPTRSPSPRPTPTNTYSPTPTRTTPTRTTPAPTPPPSKNVAYKNEGYKVPAANEAPPQIPMVSESEARAVLQRNALYSVSLAEPVRCDLGEITPYGASDAELKRYFENQMACSMRVWAPALAETGTYKAYRPTVTIYGRRIATPCGEFTYANAFYCAANQQLYLSREMARLQLFNRRGALEILMAHEYAHHVQGRIAIWGAMTQYYNNESNLSERNELKRRSELQADCFAGMYARSVSVSRGYSDEDAQTLVDSLAALADDVNKIPENEWEHGTAAARRAWTGQGLKGSSVGRCNTWTAPSNQVR
ncbi:hypothetical protein GCM10027418_09420 [Mariniluteicoccus endophyticus]